MATLDEQDRRFLGRLESSIATVQAWDSDPSLLAECRALIPLQEVSENYTRDDDVLHSGNALFLKHLALFFKERVMTWVNNPPCTKCGSADTESREMRGPETAEEQEGGASRVEVYYCPSCEDNTTTFPRYNSVRKLLQTRKGRCGEYANLFGLYCRSVGFETRYCADFTDHVWVECLVDGDWIMADACEGLIDKPSMYESGWNKNLSYIVGVTIDSVVDVTPRYTRQWYSADFAAQRRGVCTSEEQGQRLIQQCNELLQKPCSKARREELDRRMQREQRMLALCQQATSWTEEEKHGQGRISGSLKWKLSRSEAGTSVENTETSASSVQSWHVESFYPQPGDDVTISVTPATGIIVSGVKCSVVGAAIAVVVVDEASLGCILQSRGFKFWSDVSDFVETLPRHRIVAIAGREKETEVKNGTTRGLSRLGGLSVPIDGEGLLYIGQVEAQPSWTQRASYSKASGVHVVLPSNEPNTTSLKLRTERDTVPRSVASRLPESAMPLQTQLIASEEQKRIAFLRFSQQRGDQPRRYTGYTTKQNAPVYLLDATAYPFAQSEGGWNTFHYLPEPLVPEDDVGISEKKGNSSVPRVDVPLDSSFFASLLGPNLLVKESGTMDTQAALHNTRLVALYFSAHWCPPCRQFTPMLVELYLHLKEEFPTHGLQVVFVSSDRDGGSFQQYYNSMPWTAVPFETGGQFIPQIKARYGVRGIPALVVLDAMSGQIVVPMSDTRTEVMQACQGGDERIEEMFEKWITQIPHESQEIMTMLELSCADESSDTGADDKAREQHPYLVQSGLERKAPAPDPATLIKEMFAKLVADGLEPNAAAAKAIQMVAEQKDSAKSASFDAGPLNDIAWNTVENVSTPSTEEVAALVVAWNNASNAAVRTAVATALKYLENVIREPWTAKFRSFKLSNKVVDRMTRVDGAIYLICSLGLYVYATDQDFMACIPLSTDLDGMHETMTKLLEIFPEE